MTSNTFTRNRSFYGFVDTATGQLVRFHYDGLDDNRLSDDESLPVFEAESATALANVLFENTPLYNARAKTPNWGPFRAEQLKPVCVTVSTTQEDVVLPKALVAKTVVLRDIPYNVARRYAGADIEQVVNPNGLVFWLVEMPAGETLESIQAEWEGKRVSGGDRYSFRHLYKAVPVPEEYVPLLNDKQGALFIASMLTY